MGTTKRIQHTSFAKHCHACTLVVVLSMNAKNRLSHPVSCRMAFLVLVRLRLKVGVKEKGKRQGGQRYSNHTGSKQIKAGLPQSTVQCPAQSFTRVVAQIKGIKGVETDFNSTSR